MGRQGQKSVQAPGVERGENGLERQQRNNVESQYCHTSDSRAPVLYTTCQHASRREMDSGPRERKRQKAGYMIRKRSK